MQLGEGRKGKTYGGRKNCSNTTYMPLKISVKRKYLLALSMVLSCSSSHLGGRFTRRPVGETPAGVAARDADVEKSDAEMGRACRDWIREAVITAEDAGRERASAISGLVVAIVVSEEWRVAMARACGDGAAIEVEGSLDSSMRSLAQGASKSQNRHSSSDKSL
jgi:hypothetical protein